MSTQQPNTPRKPPQIIAESAIERNEADDLIFTREEFQRFDQHFKRRLAGAVDSDEISGKSTLLEIQSFFCRQRSLTEYGEE